MSSRPVFSRPLTAAFLCSGLFMFANAQVSLAQEERIDLNTADQATLESLPKIGPAKAAAIIAFRAENGPFASAQDIVKVRGIGSGTFRVFCHQIEVKGVVGCSREFAEGRDKGEGPLNINAATVEELDVLPGVGASRAQQIVDRRTQKGAFTSVDQLMEIRGIGVKTLEKMRPFIHIGPRATNDALQPSARPQPSTQPAQPTRGRTLRLNTMTARDLSASGAVPEEVAQNIVRLRDQRGGFLSVEELKKVVGVTPEMMRRLRGVVSE